MFYRIQTRETHLRPLVPESPTMMTWLFSGEADPPIPPGATKFSYSTRLGEVKVRLCDTDMDFLEVKVCVRTYMIFFCSICRLYCHLNTFTACSATGSSSSFYN
jgi:hypothetical protein